MWATIIFSTFVTQHGSLLHTEGTGWDVGNAVRYFASDESRWVTGTVLPVDAGATAGAGRLPVPRTASGVDGDAG